MGNVSRKALVVRKNSELASLRRVSARRGDPDGDVEDVEDVGLLDNASIDDGLLDGEVLDAQLIDPDHAAGSDDYPLVVDADVELSGLLRADTAEDDLVDEDASVSNKKLPAVVSRGLRVTDANVPGINLEAYMRQVNSLPMLTAEEEKALAIRLFYQQDVAAARQLVLSHLRFVVHIAKSYKGYGLPQADLIQEGNVGLMKAVKRFDPNVGVRLVSFAVHWIKAEIHEYVLKNWRIVKVATTKAQRKLFFNLRGAKKSLGWLSQAEAEQVARDLGVDVKDVKEMESRLAAHDAAFDMSSDHDDDAGLSPVQYLEDPQADPAMQFEQDDWTESESLRLQRAMDTLDDRSRSILERRWLAGKKATLHELAADFQVSAERIRQLEQSAFKKLKAAFA